jgi:hypothetical protein
MGGADYRSGAKERSEAACHRGAVCAFPERKDGEYSQSEARTPQFAPVENRKPRQNRAPG